MGQTALQFLAITQSFCKAKETMLIAFSISRLTSGRKKNNLSWRKDKSDSWHQLFNADEWVLHVRVLVGGGGGGGGIAHVHLSTNMPAWTAWTMLRKRGFSSLRRSIRPIWRVKVEASQSRTSEGTDSDWKSLSSSSVSTRRLEEGQENGKGERSKNTVSNADRGKCGGVKDDKIFIVDLWGIKSKSRNSPSNNITPYVTSKHLRPLKQHVGGVLKSNSGSYFSTATLLCGQGIKSKAYWSPTRSTEYTFSWQRQTFTSCS